MSSDPNLTNGRYVPLALYLEDRREVRAELSEIKADVKELLREQATEDGRDVAVEAAETAVASSRREKREVFRDVGLCVLSACLAFAAYVGAAQIL